MTENDFLKMVLKLAKLCGWRVAHFRPAMTKTGRWVTAVQADGKGFPDLILLRGKEIWAVELKVGRRKTTPEQVLWLEAFRAACVPSAVWTPADWDFIEHTLMRKP